MTIAYFIWNIFYKINELFSNFFQKILFFNSKNTIHSNVIFESFTVFQKLFLVLFFSPKNSQKLNIFFKNLNVVHSIRLKKYTFLHNFFLKKFVNNNNNKKNNSSIIKVISFNKNTMFTFIVLNFVKNIKNLILWNNNITININDFFKAKSLVLYNNNNVNGFIYFLNNKELISNFFKKDQNIKKYIIKKSLFEKTILKYKPNGFNNKYFVFDKNYFIFYKNLFKIKYRPTDAIQYSSPFKINYSAMFLRKNKIFNKGRYSRNRQLYRTGVYWCLWLNIINVFGLYYYFYRFVFNFGYFYIPLLIFILSIFGSRLFKYRFYNINNVFKEFSIFIEITYLFLKEIVTVYIKFFLNFLTKIGKKTYNWILLLLN